MKLNVTKKILIGYVVGFVLLLAFSGLTLFNGNKIEATTIALSQEKIPGLIAASSLKSGLLLQVNQLYELYATNDQATFQKNHQTSMLSIQQDVAKLHSLAEYKSYETPLASMRVKQSELANQFIQVMKQPEVDWDSARTALSAFSKSANEMGTELDKFVKTVSDETFAAANHSQQLTEQLIKVGLWLTGLVFLGVLGMAYYSHIQVAITLREVSSMLTDIANRRDLTYRLKQHSDDEVGNIVVSSNRLLDEFQKMALTLNGTSQEVNRTMKDLNAVTENASINMDDRNIKLRTATQNFMRDIEMSSNTNITPKDVDIELHRAQMKFIQTHLIEIDEGKKMTDLNIRSLQGAINKLQKLADNMQNQIRLLNF